MLRITKIKRDGLRFDSYYHKRLGCSKAAYWYSWVDRINFVRNSLHYSIQIDDNEGFDLDRAVRVRCKETKTIVKILGYGEYEFMRLLGDWDWRMLGTTYKTFPVDRLEEIVFGDEKNGEN